MSKAHGAVLSIVCSSCLQAFYLQSGPSHRNNDDPVLSLSLSYSQFSSVLIIVPQLRELLRYQDRGERGGRRRQGEIKRERDGEGGEEREKEKQKESQHERKERELISTEEEKKG